MRLLLVCICLALGGCSAPSSTAAENTQKDVAMEKVDAEQARTDAVTEAERANAIK